MSLRDALHSDFVNLILTQDTCATVSVTAGTETFDWLCQPANTGEALNMAGNEGTEANRVATFLGSVRHYRTGAGRDPAVEDVITYGTAVYEVASAATNQGDGVSIIAERRDTIRRLGKSTDYR